MLIPRSDLAQGKLRKELDLPGIYFCSARARTKRSRSSTSARPKTLEAIGSHNKERAFWKTAIFCVSKTQNFTQAHIRYLEWYCMQRAKEVIATRSTTARCAETRSTFPSQWKRNCLTSLRRSTRWFRRSAIPSLNRSRIEAHLRLRFIVAVEEAKVEANWSKMVS